MRRSSCPPVDRPKAPPSCEVTPRRRPHQEGLARIRNPTSSIASGKAPSFPRHRNVTDCATLFRFLFSSRSRSGLLPIAIPVWRCNSSRPAGSCSISSAIAIRAPWVSTGLLPVVFSWEPSRALYGGDEAPPLASRRPLSDRPLRPEGDPFFRSVFLLRHRVFFF